jgi:hypothetical protein
MQGRSASRAAPLLGKQLSHRSGSPQRSSAGMASESWHEAMLRHMPRNRTRRLREGVGRDGRAGNYVGCTMTGSWTIAIIVEFAGSGDTTATWAKWSCRRVASLPPGRPAPSRICAARCRRPLASSKVTGPPSGQ